MGFRNLGATKKRAETTNGCRRIQYGDTGDFDAGYEDDTSHDGDDGDDGDDGYNDDGETQDGDDGNGTDGDDGDDGTDRGGTPPRRDHHESAKCRHREGPFLGDED